MTQWHRHTHPWMADGSSVRIKVAQYFVNKKLKELEFKDPQIKVDDWTFLHAISQFEDDELEAMLLQDMGIPYEVFEASDRVGS